MPKPERLIVQSECNGYTLRWVDRAPGETLQGWYHTRADAASAAVVLMDLGVAESVQNYVDEAVTE